MKGTVVKPGRIQGINDRFYSYWSRDVSGPAPVVGDRVSFNPRGVSAVDVRREGAGQAGRTRTPVTGAPSAGAVGQAGGLRDRVREALGELPYDFVPIEPDLAVTDSPVWHDGNCPKGEERISGELLLSIRALKAFMPGHYRYTADEAARKQDDVFYLPSEFGIDQPVGANKAILEPLRDADGRVLIAGSTLKGMLRHSLGALLSAPMERVTERSYSYRPNLSHARNGQEHLVVRPAAVESFDDGKLSLRVFKSTRTEVFVQKSAVPKLGGPPPGALINRFIRGVRLNGTRLESIAQGGETLDHYYLCYKGGIDGEGMLAARFGQSQYRGGRVYHDVLVPVNTWRSAYFTIVPQAICDHYLRTQAHLADRKHGHISNRHPLLPKSEDAAACAIEKVIHKNAALKPGQLVYVELELDDHGKYRRISSLGHHYQYRHAYTDTVHWRWKGQNGKQQLRPVLVPLRSETTADEDSPMDEDLRPRRLSGARLFLGYVAGQKDHPGAYQLGRGAFSRMAGRLAFNIAVEQTVRPGDDSRFESEGRALPLKVLGMPRPSAVEFYLDQSKRHGDLLVTYGDLPGEAGGELRGRKFYPHQADATLDDALDGSTDNIRSDQSTLVRFLCKPGTKFRAALRFRDLRPWELGAVLLALEPWRIRDLPSVPDNLKGEARNGAQDAWYPLYAHKLGYGRPLGLGSVHLRIDDLLLREQDGLRSRLGKQGATELVRHSMQELDTKLSPLTTSDNGCRVLERWLQVHRFRDTPRRCYPSERDRQGNETIFNWHTQRRRAHAKVRRQRELGVRRW